MVADIRITLQGDQLEAAVKAALESVAPAVIGPFVEEAETIKANSMAIVPVDSGDLRASANEVGVNISQETGGFEIAIGYGGVASEYALEQHENPDYRHAEGKTWKYLEKPALEAVDGMEQRLAQGIAARLNDALG